MKSSTSHKSFRKSSSRTTAILNRRYKIIAVNFHGDELADIEMDLAASLLTGPNRKIVSFYLTEETAARDSIDPSGSKITKIQNGITSMRTKIESNWKNISVDLPQEMRKYWTGEPAKTSSIRKDSPQTTVSKVATSPSKLNSSTPKIDLTTPKASLTTAKVDPSTPKVSLTTGKVDPSASKVSLITSKVDPSTPKASLTTGKVDPSASKVSLTTAKVDPSTPKPSLTTGKGPPSTLRSTLTPEKPELIGDGAQQTDKKPREEDVVKEDLMEEALIEEEKKVEHIHIQMIPKKVTPDDLLVMYQEMQKFPDFENEISDYIIVIFGHLSTDLVTKLIETQQLHAVIQFVSEPLKNLKLKNPTIVDDIDLFKMSDKTKHLALFVEVLNIDENTYFEEGYSDDFYDQFIEYLYDVEMLLMQFKIYETDFVEINDQGDFSYEIRESLPTKEDSDETAVGVYLDNMCNSVACFSSSDRRQSFLHMSPFISNEYNKMIVEEANQLIHSAVSSGMQMITYWRIVEVMINMPTNFADRYAKMDLKTVSFPDFYEIVSWEAFVQSLQNIRRSYDECCSVGVTDKIDLYILRRTLYKVIDVEKEVDLSTKLCMRDFVYYIAPKLASVIRNFNREHEAAMRLRQFAISRCSQMCTELLEKAIRETPKFGGLNFSDTMKRLTSREKIYRFEDGYMRCLTENWLYEPWKLMIDLSFYGCSVYAHRWENYENYIPRVRIITKEKIQCSVVMQEDSDNMDLYVLWPNDCQVHYREHDNGFILQQFYYWKRNEILKRIYVQSGVMLVFIVSGIIRALKANGIVYELYPKEYVHEDSEDNSWMEKPKFDISEEVAFVKSLEVYDIFCNHFDVTRCDGKRLCVIDGEVVEERAHYLVYEWMDYRDCKLYAEREDGIKMVWCVKYSKCIFPCGAVLTTTVDESLISFKFGCRSQSTEKILKKINPKLVEKVERRGRAHDTYVSYSASYIMQHKNLATVDFIGMERTVIRCPHGLKISIKDNHMFLIELDGKVSFRINPGLVTIISSRPHIEERQWIFKLFMNHDADPIIHFLNYYTLVKFNKDGEMVAEEVSPERQVIAVKQEKYFLSHTFKFALAFIDLQEYSHYIRDCCKDYFYTSDTKTIVLERHFKIDQEFSMPMPELNKLLLHFRLPCQTRPITPPYEDELVFSARVIHKNKNSEAEYKNFIWNFNSKVQPLTSSLKEGLFYFFGDHSKPRYSPEWEAHNMEVREDLEYKNKTRSLYNAMLRLKVFPRYWEFQACNENLRLLDQDALRERVDEAKKKIK